MGLLDWVKQGMKSKPEEVSPVKDEAPPNIKEHVEEKAKRAKKKRKRESV